MEKHISWLEPEEKDLEKRVLAEYSSGEVRKHLEYLTTLNRLAGTEDERKAARYIKGKLEEYGVDAEIYEFDAYISYPGKAKLETLSPLQKSFPCLPHAFIASTPSEGMEAELISLSKGLDGDYQGGQVQGKVVLIDAGGGPSQVQAARIVEEKGAAAQIHITGGEGRAIKFMQMRNTWGAPTPETLDRIPKIPAISICSEDGRYLKELTGKGRVVVRLKADAWRGYKKVCHPIGTLKGVKDPEKYVLLGGHYCSWYEGATDNAAANALMLEAARVFSKFRKNLARGIKFAWWTGHTQGTYAGSTWYLDNFWEDLRDNAMAYLNMDSIGRSGTSGFDIRTTEEMKKLHERIVKETLGLEVTSKRVAKGGDQSFWGLGLPSFQGNTAFPGEETPAAGAGPYWYLHTAEDTLDKVDVELTKIAFRVYSVSMLRLCNHPILPMEFVSVIEVFEKALNDLEKQAQSHLDLTRLMSQVGELRKTIRALNKAIAKQLSAYKEKRTKGRERTFEEINRCLMALSRILMPVLSSKAGKYGQDPMGTRFKPLPMLQPLGMLISLERESDAYKVLHTSLVRGRSSLSDALDLANRTVRNVLDRV